MNVKNLTNSLVHWYADHGAIGVREWKEIQKQCCNPTESVEQCDFSMHVAENQTDNWAVDACGALFIDTMKVQENQNAYNYYLDCYEKSATALLPNSTLKNILQTAVSHWDRF
jgi:hypothetical protein